MKKTMSFLMALALSLVIWNALFVPVRAAEVAEEPELLAAQPTDGENPEEDKVVLGPGKMLALTFGGIAVAGGTVIGGAMIFRAVKTRKYRRKK
jgi:hypothetical protein